MPGCRLCLVEREEIRAGIERGECDAEIARRIGRDRATVGREIARSGDRETYRAVAADDAARERASRSRLSRLRGDPGLAAAVAGLLDRGWSPVPIGHHLRTRGQMICGESIYRELYRPDSVFGDRWRQLCRPRPSQRRRRRTRTGKDPKPLGPIVLVHHRQADVMKEPGHWEGDLLVGAGNRSAMVVLAERVTRTVLTGALTTQTTNEVCNVVVELLATVPEPLRQSLCWDQGRELTNWPDIYTTLGIPVYFCRPRSPWEKPLVENTCGLLRRWHKRRSNLYLPQHTLDRYSTELNAMPRRSLNWDSANDRYDRLVATTE